MTKYLSLIVLLLILMPSQPVLADFNLLGVCSVVENDHPELGLYKYELHIIWDTGTPYGLSHVDLIVDDGSNCECSEIDDAIYWDTPSGFLIGEPEDCLLEVTPELNCDGDPSIGVFATLYKFEPIEEEACEGGPVGEMTVHFYSNVAPAGIGEPNLFLVDKYATYSGWGMITGVFPGLPCGPINAEGKNWGEIKSDYR